MVPTDRRAETTDTRLMEDAMALRLGRAWRCVVEKREGDDPVDWNLVRGGRVVAVVEGKNRDLSLLRPTYPTVWVSEAKRLALLATGLPAFFVIRAARDDALFHVSARALTDVPMALRQRQRPRASGLVLVTDTETVRLVPVSRWARVREASP